MAAAMRDKAAIRFNRETRRWELFHLFGSRWAEDFATAEDAVRRFDDAVVSNWLKYRECYRVGPDGRLRSMDGRWMADQR